MGWSACRRAARQGKGSRWEGAATGWQGGQLRRFLTVLASQLTPSLAAPATAPTQAVPAGNILALAGLDLAILKSATVASTPLCRPLAPMLFQASKGHREWRQRAGNYHCTCTNTFASCFPHASKYRLAVWTSQQCGARRESSLPLAAARPHHASACGDPPLPDMPSS